MLGKLANYRCRISQSIIKHLIHAALWLDYQEFHGSDAFAASTGRESVLLFFGIANGVWLGIQYAPQHEGS